jgi:hypothetical protein
MKKVMLDTDVLMDLMEQKEPDYIPIATILSEHRKRKLKIFLSTQTLFEVQQRLMTEKTEMESKEILRRLAMLGKIISPDEKGVGKALHSSISDLTFAMQYHIADDHHIDYLVTSRAQPFPPGKVTVLNAEQLLNLS